MSKPSYGARLNRQAPLAQGLRSFYACNEDGGLLASDPVAGLNMAWTAQPWTSTPFGPGVTFGGNYGVATNPSIGTATAQTWTVASLVVPGLSSQTKDYVSVGNSQVDAAPALIFGQSGTGLRVLVYNVAYTTLTGVVVTAGQPYVVVSSWDGANENHWVNGVFIRSVTRAFATTDHGSIYFGSGFNGTPAGAGGWLAIWGRALSSAEATAISGSPGAIWPLLAPGPVRSLAIFPAAPAVSHCLPLLGCGK